MKSRCIIVLGLAATLLFSSGVQAAFLVEIDVDGADDGPITYNSHFAFGGDTTTASTSKASTAYGLTPADSLFGGDGTTMLDTYVYRYDPLVDADNLSTDGVPLGVTLSGTDINGTGVAGGSPGLYWVYAAWPKTDNVTGGLTQYTVESGANSFSVKLDQGSDANIPAINDLDEDGNDVWVRLGAIDYDGANGIVVTQQPTGSNSFVSMRAAAVMFEPVGERVPEPSSLMLVGLAAIGLWAARGWK